MSTGHSAPTATVTVSTKKLNASGCSGQQLDPPRVTIRLSEFFQPTLILALEQFPREHVRRPGGHAHRAAWELTSGGGGRRACAVDGSATVVLRLEVDVQTLGVESSHRVELALSRLVQLDGARVDVVHLSEALVDRHLVEVLLLDRAASTATVRFVRGRLTVRHVLEEEALTDRLRFRLPGGHGAVAGSAGVSRAARLVVCFQCRRLVVFDGVFGDVVVFGQEFQRVAAIRLAGK